MIKLKKKADKAKSLRTAALETSYKLYATAVRDLRSVATTPKEIALIERYKAACSRVEAAAKDVKQAANMDMKPGTTVVDMLEDGDIMTEIKTIMPKLGVTYNPAKARTLWPEAALARAIEIDASAVAGLIESGDLSEDAAAQAMGDPKVHSPRVSIRIMDTK